MTSLVIGIGSPFGADQIAWQLVESLQRDRLDTHRTDTPKPPTHGQLATLENKQAQVLNNCRFMTLDRPGSQLLNEWQGYQTVILIDAMKYDQQIGTMMALSLETLDTVPLSGSSHTFSLADTLKLARMLNQLPARLHLIGIEIGDYSLEQVRAEVSIAAFVNLLEKIVHE